MSKYLCTRDAQNEGFGVGKCKTAREWVAQHLDWLEEETDIKAVEAELLADIEKGNEDEVVSYIAEFWDLEITKQ